MNEHPNLVTTDIGVIRVLRIDREDKLGALSSALVGALADQIAVLAHEPSIRGVVLTGTGRGFIAGADIGEYASATPAEFDEYQRYCRQVFESFAALPQVTVAAVNGYAFGGGFELALCCDFLLASPAARFALPEIKLGLVPGGGGITRLAEAVSARWAKEVMLTGRTVFPDEALARGIVSEIVADGGLLDHAVEWTAQLATSAPLAARELKFLMATQSANAADAERAALLRLFSSDDGHEGIDAFSKKREAHFIGR
ncbi:enoyl-CoA hydratase-related protein [soil metagenome]